MIPGKKHCLYCGTVFTRKKVEGRFRLYCSSCNEPHYENPVPASCTVVIDDRGRMLLVKRNVPPQAGWWCLPGGFIELDEGPESAALRELKEETGIVGQIDRLLGVRSSFSQQYYSVLLIGYLVTSFSGTLHPGDDASDVAFFHPDDLPEIAFDSHIRFIRAYFDLV